MPRVRVAKSRAAATGASALFASASAERKEDSDAEDWGDEDDEDIVAAEDNGEILAVDASSSRSLLGMLGRIQADDEDDDDDAEMADSGHRTSTARTPAKKRGKSAKGRVVNRGEEKPTEWTNREQEDEENEPEPDEGDDDENKEEQEQQDQEDEPAESSGEEDAEADPTYADAQPESLLEVLNQVDEVKRCVVMSALTVTSTPAQKTLLINQMKPRTILMLKQIAKFGKSTGQEPESLVGENFGEIAPCGQEFIAEKYDKAAEKWLAAVINNSKSSAVMFHCSPTHKSKNVDRSRATGASSPPTVKSKLASALAVLPALAGAAKKRKVGLSTATTASGSASSTASSTPSSGKTKAIGALR